MIVYSGLKSDFLAAVEEDSIAAEIEENIYNKMQRRICRVNILRIRGVNYGKI